VFDQELSTQSYALAGELRNSGLNVMVYPEPAKLPKQFKYADKMKMKVALVLGPDEAEKGLVVVKNLSSGQQVQVARDALVESVRKELNA
jgi:histidyl-tRNA synthetase